MRFNYGIIQINFHWTLKTRKRETLRHVLGWQKQKQKQKTEKVIHKIVINEIW